MAERSKNAPTGGEWQSTEGAETETKSSRADGTSQSKSNPPDRSSGAGSEAAEGLHAVGGRDQHEKSAATGKETGRSDRKGGDRAGSEPVQGKSTEHKGSYGGEGGAPRTSSNEREPNKPR